MANLWPETLSLKRGYRSLGRGWSLKEVDVRRDGWGAFDEGRRPGRDEEEIDGRDAFHNGRRLMGGYRQ